MIIPEYQLEWWWGPVQMRLNQIRRFKTNLSYVLSIISSSLNFNLMKIKKESGEKG